MHCIAGGVLRQHILTRGNFTIYAYRLASCYDGAPIDGLWPCIKCIMSIVSSMHGCYYDSRYAMQMHINLDSLPKLCNPFRF
jgi:hypothetical protein